MVLQYWEYEFNKSCCVILVLSHRSVNNTRFLPRSQNMLRNSALIGAATAAAAVGATTPKNFL
jgi:hypothetical protein